MLLYLFHNEEEKNNFFSKPTECGFGVRLDAVLSHLHFEWTVVRFYNILATTNYNQNINCEEAFGVCEERRISLIKFSSKSINVWYQTMCHTTLYRYLVVINELKI